MIDKGVNLLDWSILLRSHAIGLYLIGMVGLFAFAVVYGFTAKQRKYRDDERMRRIQNSLDRLTQAAGQVYPVLISKSLSSTHANPASLPVPAESVLACKAATYASDELLERIDQYMEDRDRKSLALLYRTLDSDIRRLTRERKMILARGEHPRWGLLLWLTIRPAIPFLVLVIESLLLWNLWNDLMAARYLQAPAVLFAILRFISCTGALVLLYAIITADFRQNARRLVFIWLSLLISGLCLLHMLSLQAAPYLLIAQVLIFASGFRFTREPKRKERPYVGEYE
ncbi:hypothetical protein [Paenibacillus sp. CFBP13512]|uniref:hypothetical protein n=1 Tax=Paenibacillus sp. CFBP13512 TaxID=2184007 RepID=UPI0010C06C05|nr:hypothetical protein [Paenibacillus sp. CFBP13512]